MEFGLTILALALLYHSVNVFIICCLNQVCKNTFPNYDPPFHMPVEKEYLLCQTTLMQVIVNPVSWWVVGYPNCIRPAQYWRASSPPPPYNVQPLCAY